MTSRNFYLKTKKELLLNCYYILNMCLGSYILQMKLDKSINQNRAIVEIEGYLDMGTFRDFEMYVQSVANEASISNIGLNFSKCRAIDSSGMGCILRIMNNLKAKNKKLFLVEVPSNIKGILKLSQIDKYLKILSVEDFRKET